MKIPFSIILFSILLPIFAVAAAPLPLMPMPKQIEMGTGTLTLNSEVKIAVHGFGSQRKAFQLARVAKYFERIAGKPIALRVVEGEKADLTIRVKQAETQLNMPQLGMPEDYTLNIDKNGITLLATSVFGAQHGISSILQLATGDPLNPLSFPYTSITDAPRFTWRGLLIDSVRHFMPIATIKRQLNGMAAAKLNVLHWHLTDDQGWRIESKVFPELTKMASDGLYYRQSEVKEVIEYASLLGIRVVPEFGMPGHASAIAVAYPELMAKVKSYEMERHWGVFKSLLNIANPEVYVFIDNLLAEMVSLFPDSYLHIGGDEVEPAHWLENSEIQAMMLQHQLKNGHDLQNYFNIRVQKLIAKYQRTMMGWDEIFHPALPKDILVQSWRGHDSLNAVAKAGYAGILSTGFYIDQPQYSSFHYRNDPLPEKPQINLTQPRVMSLAFTVPRLKGSAIEGELVVLGEQVLIKLNSNLHQLVKTDKPITRETQQFIATMDSWMGPLQFEFNRTINSGAVMIGNSRYPLTIASISNPAPVNVSASLSRDNHALILGGEATIWSEMVTEHNLDVRIWPRLFVIAERLWSAQSLTDSDAMYLRLEHISDFSHRVIGLKHKEQQRLGFNSLISTTLGESERIKTLELLTHIAQIVEPSHYYTRHHIKFLQDEYHQRAPLNRFVDYLGVESRQVRELDQLVERFIAGDVAALIQIEKQLQHWQMKLQDASLLRHRPELTEVHATTLKVLQLIELSQHVLEVCKGALQPSQTSNLNQQLLALQSLTDEIVITGIYPMRTLYLHCQSVNKH
ncbi:family 20 glycosylhydrolase [Pseudoalteromonas peptidolytica]|nr:family 20 glycosylhydrolase [Pseudoalteromonas peptidolytica]MDW7548838.1 family 20 glycosylhydrolase [Pseudoalteromonas peptidolytica]